MSSAVGDSLDGQAFCSARRQGFALIISLALMALLVLLMVSFTALLQVEAQTGIHVQKAAEARMHARFALNRALAELQVAAGPDTRVTAPVWSAAVYPQVGVWSPAGEPDAAVVRLSSGPLLAQGSTSEKVLLVSEEEAGAGAAVYARRVPMEDRGGTESGGIAWYVSDESQKASALYQSSPEPVLVDSGKHLAVHHLDKWEAALRQRGQSRANAPLYAEHAYSDWLALSSVLARSEAEGSLAFVGEPTRHSSFHDYTALACALPTNVVAGGFRTNISGNAYSDTWITPAVRAFLEPDETLRDPARSLPFLFPQMDDTTDDAGDALPAIVERHAPVLTELKLYIGLFHTQFGEQLRARFHVGAQFWNPFTRGLVAQDEAESRLFYINFEGLPELTINNPAGGEVVIDLDQFPIGRFSSTNQYPRHETFNTWIEVPSIDSNPSELMAGETYTLFEPRGQEEGLVRMLGQKWYYVPDKGPPGPNDDSSLYFYPEDEIRFSGTASPSGVTVSLMPFSGQMENETRPAEYAEPVLVLRNIPFGDIDFVLSGAEFSRRYSTEYERDAYCMAYHIRLKGDDDGVRRALLSDVDLRSGILDFSNPEVAGLFEVEVDPRAAVFYANEFSQNAAVQLFWDRAEHSHTTDNESSHRHFSDVRHFEAPAFPATSFAALRHAAFEETPPFALLRGKTGMVGWHQVFDRYLLSGVSSAADPWPPALEARALPRLPNRALRFTPVPAGRHPDNEAGWNALARNEGLAQWVEIAGAFNVNSRSLPAWRAMLGEAWFSDYRHVDMDTEAMQNGFFRFADALENPWFSEPQADTFCDLKALSDEAEPVELALAAYRQGWRAVNGESTLRQLDTLAEELVEAVEQATLEKPFYSVAEFLESDVVQQAIDESGINQGVPPGSHWELQPGDLLAPIVNRLVVRGDTFRIRAYGDVLSITGRLEARALCEAWVQRSPGFVDSSQPPETPPEGVNATNRQFGRRFEIIRFRWLK